MIPMPQITNDVYQTQRVVLPNGVTVSITMYFMPMQQGWFITELSWQTFILRGLRITNSPNMLNQFRNMIPFGLACLSSANREPSQQNDFLSGASKLYFLNQAETQQFAGLLALG